MVLYYQGSNNCFCCMLILIAVIKVNCLNCELEVMMYVNKVECFGMDDSY